MNKEPIPFIREICKGKTEEELLEAEYYFRKYLMIIERQINREQLKKN